MYIITKGPRNINTILMHTYTLKGEGKNPTQSKKLTSHTCMSNFNYSFLIINSG